MAVISPVCAPAISQIALSEDASQICLSANRTSTVAQ